MLALGIWYWLILILAVIFGLAMRYRPGLLPVGDLALLALLALLGWKVFGPPFGH